MGFRAAPPPSRRLETFGDGEAIEPWVEPPDHWASRPRDWWGFWAYIWVPCLCVLLISVIVILDRLVLAKRPGKLCLAQWPRQAFLLFIAMSPLVCMLLFIEICHDTLLAMLFMHWGCMLFLPAAYVVFFDTDNRPLMIRLKVYTSMVLEELKTGPGWRLLLGSLIGIGVLIVMCAGAAVMSCRLLRWPLCIGNLTRHSRLYGLGYSVPFLISTSVYFTFVNPTFEELFWRVFLHREMGKELFPHTNMPDSKDTESEEEPPPAQICSETGRWVVSFFYASYHVVPVRFLVANSRAWWIAVLFVLGTLVCMSVLGRIFVWARENSSLGIVGAWTIHVWVDMAVCLIFAASVFGYN